MLDAHHSPVVAPTLVESGYDVVATATDPTLNRAPDEEVLRSSTRQGRALVTENARDFDRIVRAWAAAGEHHAGVVMTSPRRFSRAGRAYPANLIAALRFILADPPAAQVDWVYWLA